MAPVSFLTDLLQFHRIVIIVWIYWSLYLLAPVIILKWIRDIIAIKIYYSCFSVIKLTESIEYANDREEEENLRQWYAKTPLRRKRNRNGDADDDEFLSAAAGAGKKKKKKKKKRSKKKNKR